MIQQSKWFVGGLNIRKISGGLGFQEHGEVNMLWGGYIWHKFANLGILPPHNILQSTQYYLCVGAAYHRGECNNKNRIGAHTMYKIEPCGRNKIQTSWLYLGTLPNLGVLDVAEIK